MKKRKIKTVDRDNPNLEYALRLKKVRESLELRQVEFARKLDCSNTFISQIESGDKNISNSMIKKLAAVFNINPTWLLLCSGTVFLTDELNRETKPVFTHQPLEPDLENLLHHCLNSSLVKHSVLSYFIKYKLKNRKVIEEELRESQPDKKSNKINGTGRNEKADTHRSE